MRAKHVLVVEDDPTQQLIIDRLIQGVKPLTATDWASTVEEARSLLENDDYDLVIADVFLGRGGSGMDLWEEARESSTTTPFLIISSAGYDVFRKTVGPYEISPHFLSKPILRGEAAQMIEHLLQRPEKGA